MKLKYPSSFLKERRVKLGLSQQDVAKSMGVDWGTYRQWECRGQIPDEQIPQLSVVFRVSELDLLIEKYKPLITEVFGVESDTLELFLRRNSKK